MNFDLSSGNKGPKMTLMRLLRFRYSFCFSPNAILALASFRMMGAYLVNFLLCLSVRMILDLSKLKRTPVKKSTCFRVRVSKTPFRCEGSHVRRNSKKSTSFHVGSILNNVMVQTNLYLRNVDYWGPRGILQDVGAQLICPV